MTFHDPSVSEASAARPFGYQLTASDLADAFQSVFLGQFTSWRRLALALAVPAFLMVLAVANGHLEYVVFLLAIVVLVPFVLWRWVLPYQASRNFAQTRSLHDEVHLQWDERGLRFRTINSDVFTPWGHYLRWREDAQTVLLYQADVAFQFIPKRVLPPAALTELRRRAQSAGVPGAA